MTRGQSKSLLALSLAIFGTCTVETAPSADVRADGGNTTDPVPWGNVTFLEATQYYGDAEGKPRIPYHFARDPGMNTLCHTSLWRELNGADKDNRRSANLVVEICADYWCRVIKKLSHAVCNAYVHSLMTWVYKNGGENAKKETGCQLDKTGKRGQLKI